MTITPIAPLPMPVTSVTSFQVGMGSPGSDSESVVGLGDRAMKAFADFSAQGKESKIALAESMSNPTLTTNPAGLMKIQEQFADYKNRLEFVNTMVRRGTSTIETLLKS